MRSLPGRAGASLIGGDAAARMPRLLCQRGAASCGACCGIYNRRDHSRSAVAALLARRTVAFAGLVRTPQAFRAAAERLAADEEEPLFPLVRVCRLLGWLDAAETRLGCLGHPEVTGGIDLRSCGPYGVETCLYFLCPSHAWLTEGEADLVASTCADAYLYGLVVTDVPFVRAALEAVAALTGARVEARHAERPAFLRALRALFALKEQLEPGSDGLYGAFRPGAGGEPSPRAIDYGALGRERSPYDQILLCVGADPRSGNDLDALEAEVRRRLDACADAFQAS